MIAVHLNPNRRIRQGVFPTPLICGASVPVPHDAVRPFFVSQKDAVTWVNCPFLMTCVGNSHDTVMGKDVSWFVAAFHAISQYLHDTDLPKRMQTSPSDFVTWEWMSKSMGHDLVLIKVSGFPKWPHPSVPVSNEMASVGLRGCTISQGKRETENGTPGSGGLIFWNDETGEPGPWAFRQGYDNPVLSRWGEGRVLSVNMLQFFAGPNRNDDYPGMNVDNSSAPFIAWNIKTKRWELLGVTFAISSSYRTPDGAEYWEDSRNGSQGPLVTVTPEGLWKLVGGGIIQRSWADGAVPFVVHNNVALVAGQIEGLMGNVVTPPDPTTPPPKVLTPFITRIRAPGGLRNEWSGFAGCRITVGAAPLTVTHLGRWMTPGNFQSHILKLVDAATGGDVVGASVSVAMAGPSGDFKYSALPAPVILPAGSSCSLVSLELAGGDQWQDWKCVVDSTSGAKVDGLAWDSAGRWDFHPAPGFNYGPVSFQYLV